MHSILLVYSIMGSHSGTLMYSVMLSHSGTLMYWHATHTEAYEPPKAAIIGASVSESHLGSSTRPLSVCQSVYIYIYNWGERE